ncbi:hypothetical protein D3C80_2031150 [compost metagenome]
MRAKAGIDSQIIVDRVTSRYVTTIDRRESYRPRSIQIEIKGMATATGGKKRRDSRKNWISFLAGIG